MYRALAGAFALTVLLAGCGGASPLSAIPTRWNASVPVSGSKITHVVIIFQENRSVDNLFNGFPGADTVRTGKNSLGKEVKLAPIPLTAPYDIDHTHQGFSVEYDGGKLDGFSKDAGRCYDLNYCIPSDVRAYGFVPRREAAPYWTMAARYAFADRMFQTNEGPSFPAHQYIVSGTSTIGDGSSLRAADNPDYPTVFNNGGCDSPSGSLVPLINARGTENQSIYPCFDRISLMDLLDAKSLSWRYYQAQYGPGIWNGPDAVLRIFESPEFKTDVIAPPQQVLADIAGGKLADVTWVTPAGLWSDHARSNNGSGPSWVAAVVNAIGKSSYWNDTAIFVTWDDWGGWYDHVSPPQYNSYELGFRVPLIVISPYAKQHYVSHVQHEFGSILKFIEETFGLPSMHTTDRRADDLADCFDFKQQPTKFKPIPAPYSPGYFLKQSLKQDAPDDDSPDYAVVYSFGAKGRADDGRMPQAALRAVGGTLYGTTPYGGDTNANCPVGCGTVYAIDGEGRERVIYRFRGKPDGGNPLGEVIASGNVLYGTTNAGAAGSCSAGCGAVFAVESNGKNEKILYRFTGGSDGANPAAGLIAVGSSLYGTTEFGGTVTRACKTGCGTVFAVNPASGVETVLHAFKGGPDGAQPVASLVNVNGTLYGTTEFGGRLTPFCAIGCGTVFKIDTASGAMSTVYRFKSGPHSADGAYPAARPIIVDGTLYGTTMAGGSATEGTVYKVTAAGAESVIHSFSCCSGSSYDGIYPFAGLIAYNGGFYGTTRDGGANKRGTVFSITASGVESIVYSFAGNSDGGRPLAGVTPLDDMLYGTTANGGTQSEGTVFKLAP